MAQQTPRQRVRRFSGGVLTAALLAACGGGELFAILQIVTPLGGAWKADVGETVFFNTPSEIDQLYSPKVTVTGTVNSLLGVCGDTGGGAAVEGTVDNGKLTLRPTTPPSTTPCMEGSFTDLRRLEVTAAGQLNKLVYLNDRVAVNMQAGLWSSQDGQYKLKFKTPDSVPNLDADGTNTEPVAGCDVSNAATPVSFTGSMSGFNTTTLAVPTIPALVGTAFTQVQFVDGATLKLLNGSQSVTLNRQVDTTTTCPVV